MSSSQGSRLMAAGEHSQACGKAHDSFHHRSASKDEGFGQRRSPGNYYPSSRNATRDFGSMSADSPKAMAHDGLQLVGTMHPSARPLLEHTKEKELGGTVANLRVLRIAT